MKNRSLTSRNLLGGFCGGFLGVISFKIFNLLLPVGCLLGVVIGFWYQEILKAIKDEGLKAYNSWCKLYKNAITAPKDKFKGYIKQLRARLSGTEDGMLDSFFWIIHVFIRTLRLTWNIACIVARVFTWPFKNRMNGVYLATATSLICFLGLITWLIFPPYYSWMLNESGFADGGLWVVFILLAFMTLFLPLTASIIVVFNVNNIRSCPKDWQRYDRHGLIWHMLYKFLQISKVFALMALWQCLGLSYVVFGLVAVLGFMVLPISIAKASLRVLWRFANVTSHLLCFIITLLVTISSALIMREHLHGIGLWIVAMGTGCVSGMASEVVRRLIHAALSIKPVVMAFANRNRDCLDPIDEIIVPLWKKNYSWLYKYFVGWIPVPIAL